MSQDKHTFMMENTASLDVFFAEMMQDAECRKGYDTEMNKLVNAAALLESRNKAGFSKA